MLVPDKYLNIQNLIVSKTEFKSERDEIVSEVVEKLTKERIGTEWEKKTVTKRMIAIRFNKKFGSSNYLLRVFLAKCKGGKSFSSKFWWNLSN